MFHQLRNKCLIKMFKVEFWSGPGRLSTGSDRWVTVHRGWLCFGEQMYVIGCLKQSQHGSRSKRFQLTFSQRLYEYHDQICIIESFKADHRECQ